MPKFPAHAEKDTKMGWSTGTKILVGILGLIAIIGVVAVVTLTVAVVESQTGTSFPYSTNYRVSLPDGETVTMGNSKIIVMVMGDSVDTSVDGNKEKLSIGQERVISPHFARISALGIPLIDTDFQITLKYLGASGNNALFDMTVRTSKQIPELILRRLIPANMNAQAI
ncbi:MAG: hypothetical protein Q7T80_16150 [Methanoregula sp.]|nr:hypothetical protein [Methanoregula sp.]